MEFDYANNPNSRILQYRNHAHYLAINTRFGILLRFTRKSSLYLMCGLCISARRASNQIEKFTAPERIERSSNVYLFRSIHKTWKNADRSLHYCYVTGDRGSLLVNASYGAFWARFTKLNSNNEWYWANLFQQSLEIGYAYKIQN